MKFRLYSLAIALLAAFAAPAGASVVGLQVEGGGKPQVYQLNNGNFLGLWGFDNREGANPGAGAVTLSSPDDILSGFLRGRSDIVGFYNGSTPVNAGASEFDRIVWGFTIDDNVRLSNSLWIEWSGGTLVFKPPRGGTKTMPARATRAGDPFAATVVPVPASLPLLLAALGGLGLIARNQKRT